METSFQGSHIWWVSQELSYILAPLLPSYHHVNAPDASLREHPKGFPLRRLAKFWKLTLPWPSLKVDLLATGEHGDMLNDSLPLCSKRFLLHQSHLCFITLLKSECGKYHALRMNSERTYWFRRKKTASIHLSNT